MSGLIYKLINNSIWYIRKANVFVQPESWKNDTFKWSNDFEPVFPASYTDFQHCSRSDEIPESWRDQFRERLNNGGYKLLIVKSGQELAYFSWITTELEYDKYMHLGSHSLSTDPYLFHCYTIEKFRNQDLHYLATTYLMKEFALKGERLWGIIYSSNHAAQHVWKKAGLKITASVIAIGIANILTRKFIVRH